MAVLPALLAAGVASVLAPPLLARVWAVPFGFISVSVVVRTVALGGLLAGALSLIAGAVFELAGLLPAPLAGQAGGAVGLVLGLAGIAARSAHDRGPKAIVALSVSLRDPDVREEATELIDRRLAWARNHAAGSGAERFARMALIASAPLMALGRAEDAAAHLAAADPRELSPRTRGRWARALAGIYLQLGDAAAARAVVDGMERPVDEPAVETWLATIDALLAALDGQPERALALVDELPASTEDGVTTENLALRALRLAAEAHAHAARGDTSATHRALDAIRSITPAALDFARQPRGPASELADKL